MEISVRCRCIKNSFTSAFAAVISSVVTWGTNLVASITKVINDAIAAVKQTLTAFIDIGGEIISNIIQGLENNIGALLDYLSGLIIDLVTSITGGGPMAPMGINVRHQMMPAIAGGRMGGGLPSTSSSRTTNNYFNPHITVYTGKVEQARLLKGFT